MLVKILIRMFFFQKANITNLIIIGIHMQEIIVSKWRQSSSHCHITALIILSAVVVPDKPQNLLSRHANTHTPD